MFDREKARDKIRYWYGSTPPELDGPRGLLDALAGCVTDEPRIAELELKMKRIRFALDAMHEGSHDALILLDVIRGMVDEP